MTSSQAKIIGPVDQTLPTVTAEVSHNEEVPAGNVVYNNET